jgi:hypothetical protein
MTVKRDILRLSDLGKSAYLITKGMCLIETEPFDSKVFFTFESHDRCKAHLYEIEQNVPVGIQDYLKAFAQVKTALRECKEARNV